MAAIPQGRLAAVALNCEAKVQCHYSQATITCYPKQCIDNGLDLPLDVCVDSSREAYVLCDSCEPVGLEAHQTLLQTFGPPLTSDLLCVCTSTERQNA